MISQYKGFDLLGFEYSPNINLKPLKMKSQYA